MFHLGSKEQILYVSFKKMKTMSENTVPCIRPHGANRNFFKFFSLLFMKLFWTHRNLKYMFSQTQGSTLQGMLHLCSN